MTIYSDTVNLIYDKVDPDDYEAFKDYLDVDEDAKHIDQFGEAKLVELLIKTLSNEEDIITRLSDKTNGEYDESQSFEDLFPDLLSTYIFKLHFEPTLDLQQQIFERATSFFEAYEGKVVKPTDLEVFCKTKIAPIYIERIDAMLMKTRSIHDFEILAKDYKSSKFLQSNWNHNREQRSVVMDSIMFDQFGSLLQVIKLTSNNSEILEFLTSPMCYSSFIFSIDESMIYFPVRIIPTTMISFTRKTFFSKKKHKALNFSSKITNSFLDLTAKQMFSILKDEELLYFKDPSKIEESLDEKLYGMVNLPSSYGSDAKTIATSAYKNTSLEDDDKSIPGDEDRISFDPLKVETSSSHSDISDKEKKDASSEEIQTLMTKSFETRRVKLFTIIDSTTHRDEPHLSYLVEEFNSLLTDGSIPNIWMNYQTPQFIADGNTPPSNTLIYNDVRDNDIIFKIHGINEDHEYVIYRDELCTQLFFAKLLAELFV